jgi:glycerol kinase
MWITAKTGLVSDAYFSATKIEWILEQNPGLSKLSLAFGTIDSWLIWKLTNGSVHVTDVTNASRTMLMNIETGAWDSELLALFQIPRPMLPRIASSSEVVGVAAKEHLGAELPIAGIAGDQQAALMGQACTEPGLSKNTYGTGCFALLHAGAVRPWSDHGLLATRAASVENQPPQYAVEGSVFIAGAAVQWLRDQLGIIKTAAESEMLAQTVPNSAGVYFVPAFVGLGAPYWDNAARGTITGITRGTTGAHIARAALESVAYQTRDLVASMEAGAGGALRELRADGGASANNFLMQFQADILGKPIVRPKDIETTALGAAYLAGIAVGSWRVEDLRGFWQADRVFEPGLAVDRREELYAGWKAAVARARM